MTTTVTTKKETAKYPVKEFFDQPIIKEKMQQLLNKNATSFTTSVLQIVNSNTMLKNAVPKSVFNAACVAATLNLPLQNGLGFAYIVPYKRKVKDPETGDTITITEAQFQIGYKGFIQLAQRSGQFKRLVAVPVYQKQLLRKDPINGFEFDWAQEPTQDENPIGYYAYFKLLNDFSAEIYMSHEDIVKHATRYSQTFKKGYGVWHDNFEQMALKTVMKLLLSKQAPLSVEMQQAVLADQAVVKDSDKGEFDYPDNQIQDAEIIQCVDDDTFNIMKENIINGETSLQDLCDNGAEFSQEQYAELEKIENERHSN